MQPAMEERCEQQDDGHGADDVLTTTLSSPCLKR